MISNAGRHKYLIYLVSIMILSAWNINYHPFPVGYWILYVGQGMCLTETMMGQKRLMRV
jgi:hypothetical protein